MICLFFLDSPAGFLLLFRLAEGSRRMHGGFWITPKYLQNIVDLFFFVFAIKTELFGKDFARLMVRRMNSMLPVRLKTTIVILALAVAWVLGSAAAEASMYRESALGGWNGGVVSGSLAADGGGLFGTEDWDSSRYEVGWTITPQQGGRWAWLYEYTITVPKKDVSHAIIEISPGAGAGDFLFTSPDAGQHVIDTYNGADQGGSNPGIPGEIYGIKFDGVSSGEVVSLSFYTDRSPVYGHFYAKSGKSHGNWVYAYNQALDPDFKLPLDGQEAYFIVTPDGAPDGSPPAPTPVPASFWLLGSGFLGLIGLSRRNRRK